MAPFYTPSEAPTTPRASAPDGFTEGYLRRMCGAVLDPGKAYSKNGKACFSYPRLESKVEK